MAVNKRPRPPAIDLDHLSARTMPRGVGARPQARATPVMMSVEERLRFIDDIRSRSRPTTEDSTDLIRRDRDER